MKAANPKQSPNAISKANKKCGFCWVCVGDYKIKNYTTNKRGTLIPKKGSFLSLKGEKSIKWNKGPKEIKYLAEMGNEKTGYRYGWRTETKHPKWVCRECNKKYSKENQK